MPATSAKLTKAQHVILAAAYIFDDAIYAQNDREARDFRSLAKRGLMQTRGKTGFVITKNGLEILGAANRALKINPKNGS